MSRSKGENGWLKNNYGWIKWVFPIVGLLSLVWFLVRVVPKPMRAAYPCQRVAGGLAGGFLVWIAGMVGSVFAYRRGKQLFLHSRLGKAALCLSIALVSGIIAIERMPEKWAEAADGLPVNTPIGTARGIFPGRVVWVHDPDATNWAGPNTGNHWYESQCTDQAAVEQMLEDAVLGISGQTNVAAAWDAIIRYHNTEKGHPGVGYVAGEKIAIKINHTTSNAVNGQSTHVKPASLDTIDNSPQLTIALIKQLVNELGADPCDITIGDPTCWTPNYWYNIVHAAYPNVRYIDVAGGDGRIRAEYSDVEFYWSTPAADGTTQDYIPVSFVDAKYFINFPVWKGHSSGITLCGKNHYGSLIRNPNGWERDGSNGGAYEPKNGYYTTHYSLPNPGYDPGTGKYRSIVDLLGHEELGGKTVLCLIDGLFAGYYYDSNPYIWDTVPPFDVTPDWPSSILVSLDPVAADSVAYDFLLEEWPRVTTGGTGAMWSLEGGAEDYLHEAALADDPCSGAFYDPERDGIAMSSLGVHEHWNNPTDKEYTRNLGSDDGIELYVPADNPPLDVPPCWRYVTQCNGDVDGDGDVDTVDWPVFRDSFGYAYPAAQYQPCGDMDHDGDVDTVDWPSFRDNFGYPAAADCTPGGTWPPL